MFVFSWAWNSVLNAQNVQALTTRRFQLISCLLFHVFDSNLLILEREVSSAPPGKQRSLWNQTWRSLIRAFLSMLLMQERARLECQSKWQFFVTSEFVRFCLIWCLFLCCCKQMWIVTIDPFFAGELWPCKEWPFKRKFWKKLKYFFVLSLDSFSEILYQQKGV